MLRFFYSLAICILIVLLFPIALCCYPSYRARLWQRFGFISRQPNTKSLWVHAASVGEVRAVTPLLHQLISFAHTRKMQIVVTTTTPAGALLVKKTFAQQVEHYYLPLDISNFVRRFIQRANPQLLIIAETELWPNLLSVCSKQGLPFAIVNARLSDANVRYYLWARRIYRRSLANACVVISQSETDAQRFLQLGVPAEKSQLSGNMKFDYVPPSLHEKDSSIDQCVCGRKVLLAASTHAAEDVMVMETYASLRKQFSDLLLIIAPRHLNRVNAIKEVLEKLKLNVSCRTDTQITQRPDVLLIDTLGELPIFYRFADVVLVGGSYVNIGGHNPIEPASAGKAIVSGPHIQNFKDVYASLVSANAAIISEQTRLADTLATLFSDDTYRRSLGDAALETVRVNKGATEKTMLCLRKHCTVLQ